MTAEKIEALIKEKLNPVHFEITDKSGGCGSMFAVVIVSDEFNGKPLLQRHRLVNTILKDILPSIHAFEMKTLTVEQWKSQPSN
uniref:BolA-like protein 2 n=1 Tax=Hydra vulgaris TaxID=6087 RepID=T2M623_HYDVU|nr:bolA-like protein DDB_G0274439 [Hydra vulgaris]